MHGNQENLSPHIIRQVFAQYKLLLKNPIEGVDVSLNEDDASEIYATLEGPEGTPFAGGVFRMKICLTKEFPASPPKGYFLTKIFHPNVSSSGEICVNTLKQDWNSKLGIRNVLLTIKCLLIQPNPESALNEEAGKLLLEHYEDYEARARLMTEIHAMSSATTTAKTKDEDTPSTSGLNQSGDKTSNNGQSETGGAPATKKLVADKLNERKKRDKKRGLKRL